MSREAAEHRLEVEAKYNRENNGFIKRTFNNIWKYNINKPSLIKKYQREAMEQIQETGSILAPRIEDADSLKFANSTTIERYMMEGDALISKEAGEQKNILDDSTESGRAMKEMIHGLLSHKIDNPDIVEGSYQELVKTKMNEYAKKYDDDSLIVSGEFYLNNLSQIADQVRLKSEHMAVIEQIDREDAIRKTLAELEIVTGESRNTARTELSLSKTEKLIDKIENSKYGNFANPEAIAMGISVASCIAESAIKTSSKAGTPILSSIVSGVFAGAKESTRQTKMRNQHQRQMAQGGEISNLSDLERKSMEKFQYQTISAAESIKDIDGHIKSLPDLSGKMDPADKKKMIQAWVEEQKGEFDGEDKDFNSHLVSVLRQKMMHLASIEAREQMSDEESIDLIRCSSPVLIERERMDILIKGIELRTHLNLIISENPEIAEELFADLPNDSDSDKFGELMKNFVNANKEIILDDINEKDDDFNSYRIKQMVKKGTKTAVSGAVIGLAVQEVGAFMNDDVNGLAEQFVGGGRQVGANNDTLLAGAFNKFREDDNIFNDVFRSQDLSDLHTPKNLNSLKIDGDNKLVFDANSGKYDLVNSNGDVLADDLTFGSDGKFSPESLKLLQDNGYDIKISSNLIDDGAESSIRTVGTDEFVHHNQGNMVRTSVIDHFDNDTSGIHDLNELRLDAISDSNGNIVLSGARMIQGESFTEGQFGDVSNIKMMVSASVSSQKMNFEFPVDENGFSLITPDHPAYKLFSVGAGGEVEFNGGFIQAVNDFGVNDLGEKMIKPLATIVGDDDMGFVDIVTEIPRPPKEIVDILIDTPKTTIPGIEFPPFLPIAQGKVASPIEYRRLTEEEVNNGGYNSYSPDERYRGIGYSGDALISLEEAEKKFYPYERRSYLGGGIERVGEWYREGLEKNNGKSYVEWVDRKIKESGINKISPDTEVIVQIPVYAAGDSEANNFAKMLRKAYAKQIRKNNQQKEVALFLNINWSKKDENDPSKKENIEKTVNSIKAFQDKNPDIQIYTIHNIFTSPQQQVSGQALNQVTKQNIDILISAVTDKVKSGEAKESFNPLIIKNDADAKAFDKNYFEAMIQDAKDFPDTEIFSGATIFDQSIAKTNPALQLALEAMAIDQGNKISSGIQHTAGANFACRANAIAETGYGFNAGFFGVGKDDLQFGHMIEANRRRKLRNGNNFGSDFSKFVADARIMTDADRQVNDYLSGGTGVDPWDGEGFYNSDGYVDRDRNNFAARPNDIELLNIPREEAELEFSKRLSESVGAVFGWISNSPARTEKLSQWINRRLGLSEDQAKKVYFIDNGKFEIYPYGRTLLFDKLIVNNNEYADNLEKEVKRWGISL